VLVSIIQRGSRSLFRLRWKIDCYTGTHTLTFRSQSYRTDRIIQAMCWESW